MWNVRTKKEIQKNERQAERERERERETNTEKTHNIQTLRVREKQSKRVGEKNIKFDLRMK